MPTSFPQSVVDNAWDRSGSKCECNSSSHSHRNRCSTSLNKGSRGKETAMGWEAHHINSNGASTLSNCEILCQDCHKNTRSYGG